jgi:signal transduction histidine kinase
VIEPSVIQLAHDVERLQADVAALRAERNLLVESLAFHERDRQLVSYEIHDGIVQGMTAALMFLESAGAQARFATPDGQDQFERGVRVLRDAVNESRRLIRGLVPIELDECGLPTSLAKLVNRFRTDQGLEIDYQEDVQLHRLVPAVELTVLRIVQEALNNVWKHSRSPRAVVRLVQLRDEMEVTVEDFGAGFDPAQVGLARYGLAGIRERARLIGATVTIDSRPGQGTRVSLRFALRDAILPTALAGRAV